MADKEEGFVQPPTEIKVLIDKTADWVARQGDIFERKIITSQKDNPQFGFLHVGNPYFAYYQLKIREIRREELIAVEGDLESIDNAALEKIRFKKKFLGEVSDESVPAMNMKRKRETPVPNMENLRPPEMEVWLIEKPNISAQQDDIIKLAAQYIARNGRSFQNGLMEREHKNQMFDFLQPLHPLHGYFKKLMQDYTKVLLPDREMLPKLLAVNSNPKLIVEKIMNKIQWYRAQQRNMDKKRQEEEAERNAMAMIDWHDFVVVQTIDWEEDEEEEAPAPALPGVPASSVTPAGPVLPQQSIPPKKEEDDSVEMELDEEGDEELLSGQAKVLSGFDPRARPGISAPRFIAPGGHQVNLSEASEHMKIYLSNHQAREKIKKSAAAERDSNLADNSEMLNSLKEFAARRTDIFGDEEVGIGAKIGERKKKEVKPAWDGHTASATRVVQELVGGKIDEQIKAMHKTTTTATTTATSKIGPAVDDKAVPPAATIIRPGAPPGLATSQTPPGLGPAGVRTVAPPPGLGIQAPPPGMGYAAASHMAMHPMMGMGRGMMMGAPPGLAGAPPPGGLPTPAGLPMQRPAGLLRPPVDIAPAPVNMKSSMGGDDEPPSKRQKISDDNGLTLVPEREWLELHSDPVTVVIRVPQSDTKSPWPLHGQALRLQTPISETVRSLKELIGSTLNSMPVNKQKLRTEVLGYLKDNHTLAYYNFIDGQELELGIKERGGRKK